MCQSGRMILLHAAEHVACQTSCKHGDAFLFCIKSFAQTITLSKSCHRKNTYMFYPKQCAQSDSESYHEMLSKVSLVVC